MMNLNKTLKLALLLLFTLIITHDIIGQSKKVKIAFVYHTDSVFALLKSKEHKNIARFRSEYYFTDSITFNINIRESWIHFFRSNLDSTIFEIHDVAMPLEVKDNYFFVTYKYTNGFWHASRKLVDWFSQLHNEEQYDMVIILHKPRLDFRYSEVFDLNNFPSYGLIHDRNWVYSLNSLYVYNSNDGKIIAQSGLKKYYDYIRILKGADLSKKGFNEVNSNDIKIALDEVIMINNDIGKSLIKKIIKFIKKKSKV